MKKKAFLGTLLAAGAALSITAGIASAAVTGPAIYVDGSVYRTVGTPTDFQGTGAPASSYDTIYDLGGLQLNVADAAPGDRDFNGGRWMVHSVTFSNYAGAIANPSVDLNGNGVLDSDQEVLNAISDGYATDNGVVKMFECPVIKVPGGAH